jgi:hypothetical protein
MEERRNCGDRREKFEGKTPAFGFLPILDWPLLVDMAQDAPACRTKLAAWLVFSITTNRGDII